MSYPIDNTKLPQALNIPLDIGVDLDALHFITIVDPSGNPLAQFVRDHPDVIAKVKEARKTAENKEKGSIPAWMRWALE